ncbi:ABC transporter permease [Thomasclavelia sp.]|uniref:ABC transporter permease n=1 Tax=Thomasclavelia sp. TaxID=3025757 RepID=UPI0025DBA39E|nr:ABC transporter permease [Thomasclavelia sp.]
MFRYVLKRVLIGIVTLFLLSSATFFLMKATPGSPLSGEKYKNEAQRELAMKKYNLDKPVFEQYLIYMEDLVHGDLGESIVRSGREVNDTIVQCFPVTARLGSVAFATALVVGIALGTGAALSKRKWVSNICMFVATIGVSVPSFLIGILLMIVLGVKLGIFPFVGLNTPAHYVLPVMALSFYPISMICRLTRSSMLEVMRQDYIILARSKGTPYRKVVIKHALKNALIPVITYAGPAFAYMLTGSFVIESLFSIPGIGREMVSSITNRDYSMIMGMTIFLGFLVITFNIITDILSAIVDPRIKLK